MISLKETATVRLEIEYEVLVGELRVMEDDFGRMTLGKFLEVWKPEQKGARAMLYLMNLEEKNYEDEGRKGGSRKIDRPVQQTLPFSPEEGRD